MSGGREWTDEEIGFLVDNDAEPGRWIAEQLGRSYYSVQVKRNRIRRGITWREPSDWTEEEYDVLRVTRHLSAWQIADILPGRTPGGVKRARQQLEKREPWLNFGDYATRNKSANRIGRRPLVAKTCTKCGELRDGSAYYFDEKDRVWFSNCKFCHMRLRKPQLPKTTSREQRAGHLRKRQEMNALTLPTATRHGMEWTDADMPVLSNPDLTDVEKALMLRRTYFATAARRRVTGLVSKRIRSIGDPDDCKWYIDAPKAEALRRVG